MDQGRNGNEKKEGRVGGEKRREERWPKGELGTKGGRENGRARVNEEGTK